MSLFLAVISILSLTTWSPLSGLVELSPAVSSGLVDRSHSGPVAAVDQSRLSSEAEAFAQAWARRDTEALGGFMAREGIRLHLPGEDHQLIRPHQARAALDVFLRQYSSGRTEVSRISPTGEGSEEGFAEVRWVTGSPGLAEPVIFTVFIGYGLTGDGWIVTEIRVLF